MGEVELREIDDADLDAVFEMMRDADAVRMAAFTAADPDDREAFDAWIARNRALPGVLQFVVTEHGRFAGTAASFDIGADREVTYWIAPHAWGRGVATEALRLLVSQDPVRPLRARVAAHNAGSLAVLEKCGFREVGRDRGFANGVGREVEEIVYELMPTVENNKNLERA
jgi:RimJ/RimL family protein N-acetyltransferase